MDGPRFTGEKTYSNRLSELLMSVSEVGYEPEAVSQNPDVTLFLVGVTSPLPKFLPVPCRRK